MSAATEKRRVSSILKSQSPPNGNGTPSRNKVRFVELSIESALQEVLDHNRLTGYEELLEKLREDDPVDDKFKEIFLQAKQAVPLMKPHFGKLVEQLLSLRWLNRSLEAQEAYKQFVLELSIVQKNYCTMTIAKLVKLFIPDKALPGGGVGGSSSTAIEDHQRQMGSLHDLIMRLKNVIPMIFDVVLTQLRKSFPYYKRPSSEVVGYLYNVLRMTEYASIYCDELLDIVFYHLLQLDVNVPRSVIEEAEYPDEEMMFEMTETGGGEEPNAEDSDTMKHPVAETLDQYMEIVFNYIEQTVKVDGQGDRLFKIILNQFETHILPTHNTDHAQFVMFYICSFKLTYAEHFISSLWKNVNNLNKSPAVRQTSVGYIASMLARAKFVPLNYLKSMLLEMSHWVHNYIQRSDSMLHNQSLKAHLLFYSVCQAIFYVVAFRANHLTASSKNLAFLQSLQLSSIVTCQLNPLRVCLPTVATAFAGITRAYQLAYCHTILERNARRKLATVYKNSTQLPEDCLDTFFPFDPYMLLKSGKRIEPFYLQYQAHEIDEESGETSISRGRKRYESISEDVDDFIPESKRHKHPNNGHGVDVVGGEFSFSYGVSPGFHS
ncbi:RNA polymerase I-specific transcription initiation factor RRN3 [Anopheles maculipalpis]|uniref:RNA polymerase I-specific transcription initiation factor RRN3 n=1 Tax=Anopheles maculipalpis TaxID=1496333 RepID=UPI0021592F64|nr:RNA polymerase I-specific transcription initiation factor RRN3 [Anopheles maculipalpis]